jgi:hypothetical protein
MARLLTRIEKHVYYVGQLAVTQTSTPFKPNQTMFFKKAVVTLGTTPSGNGGTVVNMIRNDDPNDIIYSATFNAGDLKVTLTSEPVLQEGDSMSLSIPTIADGTAGSDLIFALTFHN